MEKIKWVLNQMPKNEDKNLAVMALDNVNQARKFHRSFPQYSVTPLAKLDGMAGQLGLGGLFVKDESYRFGLNAFKVLGGSFAILSNLVCVLPFGICTTAFCPSLFAAHATPRP